MMAASGDCSLFPGVVDARKGSAQEISGMELSPGEIQTHIIEFIKGHPRQTHAEIADNLQHVADRQRIIMNVVALSQSGILEFERIGWDGNSYSKKYFPSSLCVENRDKLIF
jgi:hypothetical protein